MLVMGIGQPVPEAFFARGDDRRSGKDAPHLHHKTPMLLGVGAAAATDVQTFQNVLQLIENSGAPLRHERTLCGELQNEISLE